MTATDHDRRIERLVLCALAADEVRATLAVETDPERRADLLLATEDLGETVMQLVVEVRDLVWNVPLVVPLLDRPDPHHPAP